MMKDLIQEVWELFHQAEYTPEIEKICMEKIYMPTVEAMNKEGRKFKGVLYFGLMITKEGPKVVEYNARFGDPEAQVVLPRLQTDILEIFNAVIDERLDEIDIKWSDNGCVCVIMASGDILKSMKKALRYLVWMKLKKIIMLLFSCRNKGGK